MVNWHRKKQIRFEFSVRIFVAGHSGLVGSAVVRAIEKSSNFSWFGKSKYELNLLNRNDVFEFINSSNPDAVVIAAAKVGGIRANSRYPVEFLSENLQIQTNLLDACHNASVQRLLFLGSSCIYPKLASQPIKESELLTGPLEPTNEPYAIAKIAGLKLVAAYRKEYGHRWISAMPTNVYGPLDNFDLDSSHVLPALIHKIHKAKLESKLNVELWGSGSPLREFIHADDLADAILFVLSNYDGEEPINIGTGQELSIEQLSQVIAQVIGYTGTIAWNTEMPDGTPRKILDSTTLKKLGWSPKILLEQGIKSTYEWFLQSKSGLD